MISFIVPAYLLCDKGKVMSSLFDSSQRERTNYEL